MEQSRWSSLPSELLIKIAKVHNTDIDTLRIRAVCSSWRSSLPPRLRPSGFPIKLPPIWKPGTYLLNYTTLYRLSPPQIGPRAGDPSDGWLFRALEVNPNRFSLLAPPVPVKSDYAPGTIPKSLNLLEYRITEICKCYGITFVDRDGFFHDLLMAVNYIGSIAVLWNDYEFVVFILTLDRIGMYWKYGDKKWTHIDSMGHEIFTLTVSNGVCYAISTKGMLFSFDASFKLKEIPMSPVPASSFDRSANYMLEYKSHLYLVVRVYEGDGYGELRLKIYKKCNNSWKELNCLRDEFFLSFDDVSVGLAAGDFKSSKANCVHIAYSNILNFEQVQRNTYYGVCDLADNCPAVLKPVYDNFCKNWPPPSWLLSD